ncbi:MAG TPA: 16S rRNA (guanine(527)-N(7))-methyltransferase RsmG [Candidatus Megaira endosymbiont of Nemacystus decipiens]|nr:16S rRNA (guanine(527)-N(7))-methyltransferase RsmG [Candidatus Megaera endosymbiont of Nemacystus decipiens]
MILEQTVSRETLERISNYTSLLIKWNRVINLISNSTIKNLNNRHIEDSIQIQNYIQDKSSKIIDLGSGAGFPGGVLSLIGFQNVTLIESDSRKAAFLKQVVSLVPSKCKLLIVNERVEKIKNLHCDFLVSRAFADLNDIFEYSKNIKVANKYLLHKGENYQQEVQSAQKDWLFDLRIHDSLTSSKGKILEINNVKPK